MRPPPHALMLVMAAALGTHVVRAQTTPPSPSASSSGSASVPRPISPEIAARLAERMPKFTPPASPEAAASSPLLAEKKTAAPTEVDRPRNTIIRLPEYIVHEAKPPRFKEREILTPRGHLALALKRYPGVRFGSLPFLSNDGWALYFYEADLRKERQAEMNDLVGLLNDPADRAKAKGALHDTFLSPK